MRQWPLRLVFLAASLTSTHQFALAQSEQPTLLNPLTLEHVMRLALVSHPELDLAQAEIKGNRARIDEEYTDYALQATLNLIPKVADPVSKPGRSFDGDSRAVLEIEKTLYDFGRKRLLHDAGETSATGGEAQLIAVQQQRQLEVMQKFFDVLLADLRYDVDNERMSLNFVRWKKALDYHELGQISDIELLELDSRYHDALIVRQESAMQQRLTRARLAKALNRDGVVAVDLLEPFLTESEENTLDEAKLLEKVLQTNPVIAAHKAALESAQLYLQANQTYRRPKLSAELKVTEYEREVGSRNAAEASLVLEIPLLSKRIHIADVAGAEAEFTRARAELRSTELAVRQSVTEIVAELELADLRRRAADIRENARDLALDRTRAIYEHGVSTDLGDSMIRLTEAAWLTAKARFSTIMNRAKLLALQGALSYESLSTM